MTTTTDLKEFGRRELSIAAKLLTAYAANPPAWLGDEIEIMMNTSSGYVFLTDADFNVAMIDPETNMLAPFLSLPYCGEEGFLSELIELHDNPETDLHPDDAEYIRTWADMTHAALPDSWSK